MEKKILPKEAQQRASDLRKQISSIEHALALSVSRAVGFNPDERTQPFPWPGTGQRVPRWETKDTIILELLGAHGKLARYNFSTGACEYPIT